LGAGGFIGRHLVKQLKNEDYWGRGLDIKTHEYVKSTENDFIKGDLRDSRFVKEILDLPFDEVYQLSADMEGAGFIFSGEIDADIMYNSAMINLNALEASVKAVVKKIF